VLIFLGTLDIRFRARAACLAAAAFLVVLTPWITRNFVVSGTPFGTAGYAVFEQLPAFAGDTLQRSINPDEAFGKINLNDFARKLLLNLRRVFAQDLPQMGGSWASAFFLVGLLVRFRNATLSRLRGFLVLSLVVFVVVQSWGRTKLSDATPDVNSENLLAVFAPLLFVFGVACFLMMLDQWDLPQPGVRPGFIGVFVIIAAAPLIFALSPPRGFPYAYPPYFPPPIQRAALWTKPSELIMSDIPAAVAWYGDRQCSALTLDYNKQFFIINDDIKTVSAVLLSPGILDSKFLTDILKPTLGNRRPWERLIYEAIGRGEIMPGFPLQKSNLESLRYGYFFLTDWERWNASTSREGIRANDQIANP
jgi:hypothetical protein